MFSFAGDTVLDPFAGTGTTGIAAMNTGRSSVSIDIEPKYVELARERFLQAQSQMKFMGAIRARLLFE